MFTADDNARRHDSSRERARVAGSMFCCGFVDKAVELTGPRIRLNLPVPVIAYEFVQLAANLISLFRRESCDLFENLGFTHRRTLTAGRSIVTARECEMCKAQIETRL
jgi:hypothetical protein